ncbi:hypothetical protein Taro_048494, partial [Colocasia esculenta]|nr:hypothetical protein [Colocasia esculenta]
IWCVEDDRAPVLGGAAVGGVCWRHQVRCQRMLLVYTRGEAVFMKALCGRFNDFPMEVQESLYQMFMSNHRFTRRSDEARSRFVWTTTARSSFKHLLYNVRKNAEKVC